MAPEVRFSLPSGKVRLRRVHSGTDRIHLTPRCRTSRVASVTCLTALCRPLASELPVAMPATVREIAAELVVTEAAVKQHLLNLYDKLEISEGTESRRIALAREAVLRGFGPGSVPAGLRRADCARVRTGAPRRGGPGARRTPSCRRPPEPPPLRSRTWSCLATPPPGPGSSTPRLPPVSRHTRPISRAETGGRRRGSRWASGGMPPSRSGSPSSPAGWPPPGGFWRSQDGDGEAPVWPEHGLMLSLMALGELGAGAAGRRRGARPGGLRHRPADRRPRRPGAWPRVSGLRPGAPGAPR